MKVSEIINSHLIWLILLAAVSGLFLPRFSFLSNYVSLILFFMILGLGLTLEFKEFITVVKTPWKVLIAIFVQYSAWIQLASATVGLIPKNTSLGVLKPRHFRGRLLSLSITV